MHEAQNFMMMRALNRINKVDITVPQFCTCSSNGTCKNIINFGILALYLTKRREFVFCVQSKSVVGEWRKKNCLHHYIKIFFFLAPSSLSFAVLSRLSYVVGYSLTLYSHACN